MSAGKVVQIIGAVVDIEFPTFYNNCNSIKMYLGTI